MLLDDERLYRSPTSIATDGDIVALKSELGLAPPRPSTGAEEASTTVRQIAPLQRRDGRRCSAASEALRAAESGLLSPRELRQQRAAAAALAAEEALTAEGLAAETLAAPTDEVRR